MKGKCIKITPHRLDKVPPKPPPLVSTTPRHRRLWQAAKLAIVTTVSVFGFVSALDQIWGPVWPMPPEISFLRTSGESLSAETFLVKNPSAYVPLQNVLLTCGLVEAKFPTAGVGGWVTQPIPSQVGKINAKSAVAIIPDIPPGVAAPFTCNLRSLSGIGGLTMARAKILVIARYSRRFGIVSWSVTSRSRPFVCGHLPSGEECVDEASATTEADPLMGGIWQTLTVRAMCGEHADRVCTEDE